MEVGATAPFLSNRYPSYLDRLYITVRSFFDLNQLPICSMDVETPSHFNLRSISGCIFQKLPTT